MFKNIFRLQPGHILTADDSGVRTRKYWDIHYPQQEPQSPQYLLERFRELLEESVRMRLIAEVPLGVFLSGGLDSSAILAMMSKSREVSGGERVKTFSVGYEASGKEAEAANEFEYAQLAARSFGSEHHEYRLDAGSYPKDLQTLLVVPPGHTGAYLESEALDPWGQPFRYKYPGTHNPGGYDLYSIGPNKVDDGGSGDDIANWKRE